MKNVDIFYTSFVLAILCPELQFSELFINPSNFTGYKYNSVVTFKCKNGYYIKGHPALRCMIDLQNKSVANWNETQPVCEGECYKFIFLP